MFNVKKIACALMTSVVFISIAHAKLVTLDSSNPEMCYAAITDQRDADFLPIVLIHNSDYVDEEKMTLTSFDAVVAANPDRDFYTFDFAHGSLASLEKCIGHAVKLVAGPVVEMFIRLEDPQTKELMLSNPISAMAGLDLSVEDITRTINLENGKKFALKRQASKYLLVK